MLAGSRLGFAFGLRRRASRFASAVATRVHEVSLHCARKWRPFSSRPASSVSEARAAVRGRQQTELCRFFERDDSIDVLACALRSGAAHVSYTTVTRIPFHNITTFPFTPPHPVTYELEYYGGCTQPPGNPRRLLDRFALAPLAGLQCSSADCI